MKGHVINKKWTFLVVASISFFLFYDFASLIDYQISKVQYPNGAILLGEGPWYLSLKIKIWTKIIGILLFLYSIILIINRE